MFAMLWRSVPAVVAATRRLAVMETRTVTAVTDAGAS